MVECGGLENRCAARHRGFKSYFLRQNFQARSLNGLFVLYTKKPAMDRPLRHLVHLRGGKQGKPFARPRNAISYSAKKVSITKSTGISRPSQRRSAIAACCTKGPAPSTVLQPQERASCISSVSRGLYTRSATISSGRSISAARRQPGSSGYPTVVVFTTRVDSASDILS